MQVPTYSIEIQPRDLEIMRSLFESRLMTAAHVSSFHFNGSREATKKRLQKLKQAGFVAERRFQVSTPAILFLTTKALKLLESKGIVAEYPPLSFTALQKRTRVSAQTTQHELEVIDIKAAFHLAIGAHSKLHIEEFSTWPACYEFLVADQTRGRNCCIQPDAFIRVNEKEIDDGLSEHCFFLEVDRSTEVQNWLVNHAACYEEYYRSGGFAEWSGGTRDNPKEYPFRVLMIFKNAERRNNLAERLLQNYPQILARVWLSTFEEVKRDPLGKIWIRPRDYRDVTRGTRFDPELERKSWAYRRQTEREILIESKIKKLGLFDSLHR